MQFPWENYHLHMKPTNDRPAQPVLPHSTPESGLLEERIRQRAYFLWLDRGCPQGGDWDHWFAARQELLLELSPAATGTGTPGDAAAAHYSIRTTVATNLSDPAHRFHSPGAVHDGRLNVVAGEARQRVRGRRFGGSLRAAQKKPE